MKLLRALSLHRCLQGITHVVDGQPVAAYYYINLYQWYGCCLASGGLRAPGGVFGAQDGVGLTGRAALEHFAEPLHMPRAAP